LSRVGGNPSGLILLRSGYRHSLELRPCVVYDRWKSAKSGNGFRAERGKRQIIIVPCFAGKLL
jgi:hypothetical protein